MNRAFQKSQLPGCTRASSPPYTIIALLSLYTIASIQARAARGLPQPRQCPRESLKLIARAVNATATASSASCARVCTTNLAGGRATLARAPTTAGRRHAIYAVLVACEILRAAHRPRGIGTHARTLSHTRTCGIQSVCRSPRRK